MWTSPGHAQCDLPNRVEIIWGMQRATSSIGHHAQNVGHQTIFGLYGVRDNWKPTTVSLAACDDARTTIPDECYAFSIVICLCCCCALMAGDPNSERRGRGIKDAMIL